MTCQELGRWDIELKTDQRCSFGTSKIKKSPLAWVENNKLALKS